MLVSRGFEHRGAAALEDEVLTVRLCCCGALQLVKVVTGAEAQEVGGGCRSLLRKLVVDCRRNLLLFAT